MGSSLNSSSIDRSNIDSSTNKGPAVRVKSIGQLDGRSLGITWTDDLTSKYDVVELRRKCPCATCIDEWSHEPILKPDSIPETMRPVKIDSVGQYALSIQFGDGHKTGIYTFAMLRKMAHLPCQ